MKAQRNPKEDSPEPSSALIVAISFATGALVANLYYAQPMVATIARDVGIGSDIAGAVTSVTQIGYGIGLMLLVPLADLVENRRLVLFTLVVTTLALVATALSNAALPFFAAALAIGICSTGVQVLLPFVAHLVPEARRGRTVGNVMAGLLTGIMLARPAALFVSASFGWRAIFWLSAALMVLIGIALVALMPRHRPTGGLHYGQVLGSMAGLARSMPAVRWRAAYQALMFMAFNLFWTASPMLLADRFHLGEHGIGLFALAGAGGALAAPLAGRLADGGHGMRATLIAMATLGLGFLLSGWAASMLWLGVMAILAIVIDAAVQINQVVSQRIIFSTPSETRGRVNAIYMTVTFAGGALGSVLGSLTYHHGGWTTTALAGGAIGLVALMLAVIQLRGERSRRA
ncbi:MFS transporter [Flavisphingomonas formosensis]|uniref:MFS transporter n=1 Tax=Flavisphingomonas formosensis TaxID=861534 RepID=UPI0012F9355D|nr:MFS transporter [Sphingomonas formosensis]